jgi:hypothetical protein
MSILCYIRSFIQKGVKRSILVVRKCSSGKMRRIMPSFAPVCQAAEVSVILQKIGPNGKTRQSVANPHRES